MKTYHIILLIVISILFAYIIYSLSRKTEYLDVIHPEISNLLRESNDENYYMGNNDLTSVDTRSFPIDSETTMTGQIKISGNNTIGLGEQASWDSNISVNDNCEISQTDKKNKEYLKEIMITGQKYCKKDNCRDNDNIKTFNRQFFDFNKNIEQNSRPNVLASQVPKIYLESNTELGRQNALVSDVYDELTKYQTITDKTCVNPNDIIEELHSGTFEPDKTKNMLVRENKLFENNNNINLVSNSFGFDQNQTNYAQIVDKS